MGGSALAELPSLLSTNNFLPNHLVLLTTTRSAPDNLLVRTGHMSANAHVLPEPACGEFCFKHLVDLLECPVLNLRKVEVDPNRGDKAGWTPDPAYGSVSITTVIATALRNRLTVLWTPVERIGIDEVWRRECSEPCTRKSDSRCDAERV
jgi:hypothetical protein